MKVIDWKKYSGPNANKRRISTLHKRLDCSHGPFKPRKIMDPVDELILTVLSQNTNDTNRDRAYGNLKKKYRNWQEVLNAPDRELKETIKVGGLANNKAKSIKAILSIIKTPKGDFKLDFLETLPLEDALDYLTALPGVGLKTASCVMLFSFGRPSMPVDTHVHRLAIRLGLAKDNATPDHVYYVLMAITQEKLIYPFHIYLIQHGKEICRARSPRCSECTLCDLCPTAFSFS
jgi:endonuclease III